VIWIHEALRRQGYGRALLAAAEEEARRRGCRYAHLDTMSFQALGFYEQQGYQVFGKLDDLPAGHYRYFLKKALK
jgi:ribosomal protein S18 acetylase RimI-like enzyme